MAYIPFTYVPITGGKKNKAKYTLPTGGVRLGAEGVTVDKGGCARALNLEFLGDRIRTKRTLSTPKRVMYITGNLNGFCREPFYGRFIFHIGTVLCAYNAASSAKTTISEILPDSKSLICHFMSKVYIFSATRIFSLDSEFNLKEEEADIFAPLMYEKVNPAFPNHADKNDTPLNLAAPRISVSYISTTSKSFLLPHTLDTARGVEVYIDDELADGAGYDIYENKIVINDSYSFDNSRAVRVTYFLKNPEEIGYEDFVGGCKLAIAFGGNANGGTRLFFTGNSGKKGYYYKSELNNPLHIRADEYEIIGDGCENVTALKKMYGDLLIFTENSIFKMCYNFTSDGTYFSVKELSCQVGCDCPDSVALIDNRVVFANSKKGVFIVDSTEETGEQNIKPISGNILKGRDIGLLDNTSAQLTSACAVDMDRKYILFVGTRAYIWDYDATPYLGLSSYNAAQSRLCWYIYDGMVGEHFVNSGGVLVSLCPGTKVYLCTYSDGVDSDGVSVLDSGISECFMPLERKQVTGLNLKIRRGEGCEINLSLYGDGEKYYEIRLPERTKEKEKIKLHPPRKSLYGFGFCIEGTGEYEIEEIEAEYIKISE